MRTWLVTGGSGFLGRHLLAALKEATGGLRVVALGRRCPDDWPIDHFVRGDLDAPTSLAHALDGLAPAVVVHLAGRTPPADPWTLYRANTRATAHLLGALQGLGARVRVILAGSAAELGPVPVESLPIGEDCPCRPVDAYGLSKWAATRLGLDAGPPLEVVAARVFNPIGPGLPTSQAFGRFAADLARPGPDPVRLVTGDLEARRDFLDARDVARALIALADRGRPGSIYHVGSGVARRVGDGLETLIELSGRQVARESNAARRGPVESRADIRRIVAETGWQPRIDWETSLADLWSEVRARALATRRVA